MAINDSSSSKTTDQRRKYILDFVKENPETPLSFDDVQQQFGKLSPQTLHNDARYFRQQGAPVSVASRRFIYDLVHSNSLETRRNRNVAKKKAIAVAVAKLVSGDLALQTRHETPNRLQEKLNSISRQSSRLIALDAGSTCEQVCKAICELKTPARNLKSISFVTNSLSISNLIHLSSSKHRLFLIGGKVRGGTDVICGTLAERSFESMGVFPDIAIVGVTSTNQLSVFTCSHEDEAAMKRQILGKSNIRAVVVDSTKLLDSSRAASWEFATIYHDIDLVFTNEISGDESIRDEIIRVVSGSGAAIVFC